mmetsp:Transcript_54702/g.107010  ORF Transcript_54702/g.107010 Transcript_54702/m.107010 type:complete len:354 (+) Transcript_54702:268-1329(+)
MEEQLHEGPGQPFVLVTGRLPLRLTVTSVILRGQETLKRICLRNQFRVAGCDVNIHISPLRLPESRQFPPKPKGPSTGTPKPGGGVSRCCHSRVLNALQRDRVRVGGGRSEQGGHERGPLGRQIPLLCWDLREQFKRPCVERPADGSVVLPRGQHQIRVLGVPLDTRDALRVPCRLLEGVLGVSQVPQLKRRVSVVVKRHSQLSGHRGGPGNGGARSPLVRILEADNALFCLEVPHPHNAPVGGCGKDVGDLSVPLEAGNLRTLLVNSICAWRCHFRRAGVLTVDDLYLGVAPPSRQEVCPPSERVEFYAGRGSAVHRGAPQDSGILVSTHQRVCIPELDEAPLESPCEDSCL